jgi:3-oxoacyl-[acyl-carrier protein] reductase
VPDNGSLSGRTALVTGAGSATGIGFASARRLAALGAHVVLVSTTERIHERAAEVGGTGLVADLTDDDQVASAVAAAGHVDVLVNNAGMTAIGQDESHAAVHELAPADWRAGLETNLTTAFLVTRAVLPGMVERGWGRIVNVASVTGPVNAMPEGAAYAAAKAGMVGLTRAVAVEVAGRGVTCNAVAPGWIASGSQTAAEAGYGLRTPAGRSGTPDEVAAAVVFLAGPDASYVTGACLVVDGGNSVIESR